ncbi:serine/threonine-protein kinase PknG [Amycolatopsis xylanica]|uniref:non-specific serine/threonine protein kinase n=1 Tax=Amycolatopsis xylanica TaxID=589385 RepID=A0A1H2RYD1_9PSEU|nr:serine/threonine-protein kinase [Amycolatopsis xylanica]SDW24492.1 serine/threonine-protein kinase PknG [Amycolatopsis xylanica]
MTACVRPGCDGEYLSDDSCDTCGFDKPSAPVAQELPAVSSRRSTTGAKARHRGSLIEQVELPPFTPRDPATAVLADPEVPYRRRVCHLCRQPVGQPRGEKPGLTEGFCPRDRTPFSFRPSLDPGQHVDKYEILGCLAYGGYGWIYLARDRNLGDGRAERWVVLKGLIDTGDPDAVAAAVAEQRYLVEVDHPNIVKIHDFVRHTDPHTGATAGYIVMEYLGGRTLRDVLQRHQVDGEPAPLPVRVVLKYADEILGALGYLHRRGLRFCDLKPDNVMQVDQRAKLIDLGAMLHEDDKGAVFGTEGYQAPEIDDPRDPRRPCPDTDLYTLGRTMAVLGFPFAGFTEQYKHSIPPLGQIHWLERQESFHRLLIRAAHPEPARRFTAAEDFRDQVAGVLAEVLAKENDEPGIVVSTLFTREARAFGTGDAVSWQDVPSCLPSPLVDPDDAEAAFLMTLGGVDRHQLVETLVDARDRSPEVLLRLAGARIAVGELEEAKADLADFGKAMPGDWRTEWYLGVAAFAGDAPEEAKTRFDAVYSALPGELAPKLALAAAHEWLEEHTRAEELYSRVWHTDDSYVSAAFGLARMLALRSKTSEAVSALDAVPEHSTHHLSARIGAIRLLIGDNRHTDAVTRLREAKLDDRRHTELEIEVLNARLVTQEADDDLRRELEQAYRKLAKLTTDRDTRSRLVDRANEVRPKTLV